ncbi:MAG TPA: exopolysaccharide biosynthesis polyprenyl glycosylphosphotransferase [Bacteroidota bacterium]|nr:exopolysaccharide biosynthesis polyprenyl glycosylphosphotransferase [Bacteroidota bacterium]
MLKRHWKLIFIVISQFVDFLAMVGAAGIVLWLDHETALQLGRNIFELKTGILVFGICYVTLASMFGYYRGVFHLKSSTRIGLAAKAYILSIFVTLSVIALIFDMTMNRHAVIIFCSSFPLLFLLCKFFLRWLHTYFHRKGFGVHPSLIAGFDSASLYIYNHFDAFPELGYSVRGFIMKQKNANTQAQPQYTLQEVEEVIRTQGIDRIFIPSTDLIVNGYASLKKISRKHRIKLKVLSPHARTLLKYAKVQDIAGITLTTPPRYKVDKIKLLAKRLIDIIGSLMLITIFSPIFILAIVLIWIEDGSPVFYTQQRTSIKDGKSFHFIKFRTMILHAEDMLDRLKELNESDGPLFKMKHDPRVTKVGRSLRKFSIDELPQLFNVLKGDMSLVGPRPLPPSDFENVDTPDEFWDAVKERGRVKPGMTGIWQISGRSDIKFTEMILLDLYYVENHSLMFDLEILFETIPAVLFGKGAY